MTMADGRESSQDTGRTIGGALALLIVGVALGLGWNAMGLASNPARGLPWIAPPRVIPSVESLQPPAGGVAPADTMIAPGLATASGPDTVRARVATGPVRVELAAFKRLYDAGAALVVDAREPGMYDQGHIAGAISLPYNGALADPGRIERLDPGPRPIVVYCSGAKCELALDLAKFLVESGKRKVLVFEGGYHEWQAAGYPVEHGPAAGARP